MQENFVRRFKELERFIDAQQFEIVADLCFSIYDL